MPAQKRFVRRVPSRGPSHPGGRWPTSAGLCSPGSGVAMLGSSGCARCTCCRLPASRGNVPAETQGVRRNDPQPRPHLDHPCRQPAAQREALRAAGAPGGGRALRRGRARRRNGQGGAPRRRQAADGRDRHRQRRRAAAGRLPDLRAATHDRLCRRIEAAARARIRGIPGARAVSDAPVSRSRPGVSTPRPRRRARSTTRTRPRSRARSRASSASPRARSPSSS